MRRGGRCKTEEDGSLEPQQQEQQESKRRADPLRLTTTATATSYHLRERDLTKNKIKEAHRRIMLANHPDRGGSPYLSSKVGSSPRAQRKREEWREEGGRESVCVGVGVGVCTRPTGGHLLIDDSLVPAVLRPQINEAKDLLDRQVR